MLVASLLGRRSDKNVQRRSKEQLRFERRFKLHTTNVKTSDAARNLQADASHQSMQDRDDQVVTSEIAETESGSHLKFEAQTDSLQEGSPGRGCILCCHPMPMHCMP
jgi:hypothetical protein